MCVCKIKIVNFTIFSGYSIFLDIVVLLFYLLCFISFPILVNFFFMILLIYVQHSANSTISTIMDVL